MSRNLGKASAATIQPKGPPVSMIDAGMPESEAASPAHAESALPSVLDPLPEPPREAEPDRPPPAIALINPERRQRSVGEPIASDVAKTRIHIRNWRWPGAVNDFTLEPWLRTVDRFYINAVGGPLAVDEPRPRTGLGFEDCRRKAKALFKRGIRYLVIEDGMSLTSALLRLEQWDEMLKKGELGVLDYGKG